MVTHSLRRRRAARYGVADRRGQPRYHVDGVQVQIGYWKMGVDNLSLGGFLAGRYHGRLRPRDRFVFTILLPLSPLEHTGRRTLAVQGEARVVRLRRGWLAAEYATVDQRLITDLYFFLRTRR